MNSMNVLSNHKLHAEIQTLEAKEKKGQGRPGNGRASRDTDTISITDDNSSVDIVSISSAQSNSLLSETSASSSSTQFASSSSLSSSSLSTDMSLSLIVSNNSTKPSRRFAPRELDFQSVEGDFVVIYPPKDEAMLFRFWIGESKSDFPVDGNKRKHCPIIFYTEVAGKDYLLFEQETTTEKKLPYSSLLGKVASAQHVVSSGKSFISISQEDRDRFTEIAKELDKE